MSENKNHIFTIDNRFISYSVYEQALKDIEALKVENKLLKNQLCFTNSSWPHEKHLHEKIEQLKSDNEKLQAQVNVMEEALKVCALGETQFDGVEAMHSARQALEKVAEIKIK